MSGHLGHAGEGALRVLVNGLSAALGGGGSYLSNQLAALAELPGLRIRVLASEWLADRIADRATGMEIVRFPDRPPAVRAIWEQTMLRRATTGHDVLYMPANFALLGWPRPQVLAVQNAWYFSDEAQEIIRQLPSRPRRLRIALEARLSRRSVRRASRVVCVSETLREMLEERMGPQEHLHVVRPAAPTVSQYERADSGERPYVLCVGHDDPHKGWGETIALFSSDRSLPPLLIVGRIRDRRAAEHEHALQDAPSDDRVSFLGPIDDAARLSSLYRDAACVLAPARFESFGLTAAEALAHAVPVAASDIPAHREVCGEAAVYFTPGDAEQMARAVKRCLREGGPSAASPLAGWTWSDNAAALADLLWEAAGDAGD